MTRFVLAAAALACASVASAQIGYEPALSPYRDLERRHEITFFSGSYLAKEDPAGVAPRDGTMVGFRYQWLAGGPVNLTGDFIRVGSERRVLDPDLSATCTGKPAEDCKMVGLYRWPLYFFDAGMSVNLTGARSYRRFVPEARFTLGVASDFHTSGDIGDFEFGTKFTLSYGGGIRWIPKQNYQVRIDVSNRYYAIRYPETYFALAPDTTRIRPFNSKARTSLNNAQLSIGLSYLVGR